MIMNGGIIDFKYVGVGELVWLTGTGPTGKFSKSKRWNLYHVLLESHDKSWPILIWKAGSFYYLFFRFRNATVRTIAV